MSPRQAVHGASYSQSYTRSDAGPTRALSLRHGSASSHSAPILASVNLVRVHSPRMTPPGRVIHTPQVTSTVPHTVIMYMRLTNCAIFALCWHKRGIFSPSLKFIQIKRQPSVPSVSQPESSARFLVTPLSMSSTLSSQMIGLTIITSIAGAALAFAGIFFLVQHSRQDDHRFSTQRYLDCPSPLLAPRTHDSVIALNNASYRQGLASIPEASTEDLFLKMLPPCPRNSLRRDNAHSIGQNDASSDTLHNVEKTQQTFHAASSTPDREPNAHTNHTVCRGALWEVSDVQRVRSLSSDTHSNQGHLESPVLVGSQIGWELDELDTLDGYVETEQDTRSANVPTHRPCLQISGIRSDHGGDCIHDWTQFTKDGFP